MNLRELHEGDGNVGHFGEFFVVLGLAIALGGGVLIAFTFGGFADWNQGTSVNDDGAIAGALFMVMGIGFAAFGGMAIYSGWGRHHPDFDKYGTHPPKH